MSTFQAVVIAALSAGLLTFLRDMAKAFLSWREQRNSAPTPQAKVIHEGVHQANESILVIAKARDDLGEDNERLRGELREEREQHARDRSEWGAERSQLRQEIADLEARLRAVLKDLLEVKAKHHLA